MSIPMPTLIEKNACPIALSTTLGVILEKSGLKRKFSFGESGEEYRAYAENNENEEKNGHQDIGCLFDTAVYPAHENDVVDQDEEDNPYKRFERRGNESIEFYGIGFGRLLNHASRSKGLYDIFECPARDDEIETDDNDRSGDADVSDDFPPRVGSQFIECVRGIRAGTSSYDKFGHHDGIASTNTQMM